MSLSGDVWKGSLAQGGMVAGTATGFCAVCLWIKRCGQNSTHPGSSRITAADIPVCNSRSES